MLHEHFNLSTCSHHVLVLHKLVHNECIFRTFGTWPIAKLYAANKKKVIIEGPVCDYSEVMGWHLKRMRNVTDTNTNTKPPLNIHISSFGFNSSILWDPERWGRTSSVQDTSQVTKYIFFSLLFFCKFASLKKFLGRR